MRNLKYVIAAAALATTPGLAHAQWYVGLDAGASFLEDTKTKGSGYSVKSTADTGWMTQGQVGYAFGPWRVEGELSYRDNALDKISGAAGHGDIATVATMVNGIYEFMPDSTWHPFVGVGVGAANVDVGTVRVNGTPILSGDDWQFAYQGFAGVGFDVSRNVELKAQYRYFATTDYSVKTSAALGSRSVDSNYNDHAVLVGFTYKFGAPPAPAPRPAPAPVAAPAPAPAPAPVVKPAAVQRNFMVFFDFDKAVITPEASRVIQQAANTARNNAVARINLTGHTDLSGSEAYNMKLSIKRGEAVKAELIKLGVPASQIDVVGKGKSTPLVQTPDGVREPQNRRVEILLP